jgi:hypothetical protein
MTILDVRIPVKGRATRITVPVRPRIIRDFLVRQVIPRENAIFDNTL